MKAGYFVPRSHAPKFGFNSDFWWNPPKSITIPLWTSSSAWNIIVSNYLIHIVIYSTCSYILRKTSGTWSRFEAYLQGFRQRAGRGVRVLVNVNEFLEGCWRLLKVGVVKAAGFASHYGRRGSCRMPLMNHGIHAIFPVIFPLYVNPKR